MNLTLGFLLGEWLLVSLAAFLYIGFSAWRRHNVLKTELRMLSERIHRIEPLRQIRLENRLKESLGLSEDKAESLSVEIIRSERTLFRTFAEIQFGREVRKIGGFDQSLYSLLDRYWELIAIESEAKRARSEKGRDAGRAMDPIDKFSVEAACEPFDHQTGSLPGRGKEVPVNPDVGSGLEVSGGSAADVEPSWEDAFAEVRERLESQEGEVRRTKYGPGT